MVTDMVYSPWDSGTATSINYVTGNSTVRYTGTNTARYTTSATADTFKWNVNTTPLNYSDVVYSNLNTTVIDYPSLLHTPTGAYAGTGDIEYVGTGPVYVTGNTDWLTIGGSNLYVYPQVSKEDEFKNKLKSNLAIIVKSRVESPGIDTPAERVAMETLREVISEAEFRKYLRYGFVLIKGKSGATYQIFRNRSHTKVWQNGELVEEICVRIPDAKIPPTDKIIAFRQIIQTSEDEFKKLGNVYKMRKVA
jgi:hypothetical protein